jgi:hypothetical protein
MEWQDGDIWSTTLPLSPGHHEFKLVIAAADASSSIWEGGENRTVTVPSPATTGGSSYIAECHWGNPETSIKPGGPEGVATYDDEDESDGDVAAGSGQTTVGKMTIEGGEVVDDDEEKEIGKMTIGKMTVEGGESGTAAGTAGVDGSPSVREVGKMTIGKMTIEESSGTTTVGKMTMEGGVSVRNDLIDTGIGAEEGFSAAEAMTPEVAMAMASGDEDQLESPFAKAISGILQNLGLSSSDDDDADGSSTGGGVGRASGGNKPSGGGRSGPSGSTPGAGPSSFKYAAAAAAAAVMITSTSAPAGAAMPFAALPRQFFRGPRY